MLEKKLDLTLKDKQKRSRLRLRYNGIYNESIIIKMNKEPMKKIIKFDKKYKKVE
jgi:hypothetical protein